MKFKAIAFSFMTLALAFMFFNASPARAQINCSNIAATTSGLWPPPTTTEDCAPSGASNRSTIMRQTLETIGSMPYDAAARLRGVTLTTNDTLSLSATDTAFGTITATHTVAPGESYYSVLSDLAGQIQVSSGYQLSANVSAGDALSIVSYTGHTTTYSQSTSNPSSTGPATETLTIATTGNDATVTIAGGTGGTSITWYYYADHADFLDPTAPGTPKPSNPTLSLTGYTLGYSRVFYGYTVVFETAPSQSNDVVAHTTAHETGHHVDRLYGNLLSTANTDYSASTAFQAAFALDLAGLQNTPVCTFDATDPFGFYASNPGFGTPNSSGGQNGWFTGFQDAVNLSRDNTSGKFICDGSTGTGSRQTNSPYAGLSGLEILSSAYPLIAPDPTASNTDLAAEFFAERFAYDMSFGDFADNDSNPRYGSSQIFFTPLFTCSKLYVDSLVQKGTVPTSGELAAAQAYVEPEGTSSPFGPRLRTHFCDGTVGEWVNYNFGQ